MINILKEPDDIRIFCENENIDAAVRIELKERKLYVWLNASVTYPRYVCMRWNHRITEHVKIMGDRWERSYGDLEWRSLNGENFMPWYFLANYGNTTTGCGVMVQPNSLVCFQCDASGVTAWFDVRNGGGGVKLAGRELLCGIIVCEQYDGISAFAAAKEFCKVMSPKPILPKEPVYGGNNWYYAYGNSSRAEILKDAALLAELAGENENKPYMVIDDGWSINSCAGPWEPNEKYGDMKSLAEEFKAMGLRPGIWFRPLRDLEAFEKHPEWRFHKGKDGERITFLDPSHPEVKTYLRGEMQKLRNWGYELVKHDFSTFDIFERFGVALNGKLAVYDDWTFYDRTKTSAEIVLDFYRLIREESGDMLIIGCNTLSHLSAGIFEINRIGDDTSSRSWSRTRAIGVNTLAFRLCQDNAFYKIDADCVGILGNRIDWKLNRQWLELLAKSGSPLFVSMQPGALTEEMKKDLKEAFAINSVQQSQAEPIDWMYNNAPQSWLIDGERHEFDFIMDCYPDLLAGRTQEY